MHPGRACLLRWLFPLILSLWAGVTGCSRKPASPDGSPIVARVGPEVITAREFRLDYESGFANLKQDPDPRLSYLQSMINERLLALEGYRQGLDRSPRVRRLEARLRQELLVEALIDRQVKRRIKVSQEEIREAINKSKVYFKFRYWVEPSLDRARRMAEQMREKGFAAAVDDALKQSPELKRQLGRMESDYVNYLDVPEELLTAIQDLPIGEISDPVALNGQYFFFQLLDIRRQAVTTNEYIEKAPTFEQIVFYRKLDRALEKYLVNMLDAEQVVTRGPAFALLGKALQAWRKQGRGRAPDFRTAVQKATPAQPALWALRQALHQPFFTYRHGQVTVGEFLDLFNPDRVRPHPVLAPDFPSALHRAVAFTIRDYLMARQADKKGYYRLPAVQRQLHLWRNKWVFQEYCDRLLEGQDAEDQLLHASRSGSEANPENETVAQGLPRFSRGLPRFPRGLPRFPRGLPRFPRGARAIQWVQRLQALADSLRQVYPVEIHHEVLDTIQVVRFKKSRWATTLFFHSGTNRLAYPITEPMWGIENSNPPPR
ncbi:MAG: peptidyl-prolyl cis-trans isomerase [Calditrichaeota bacterium]|nr:MAG: peptidyl-prolyl cis-trans isomerase [Calditrichota bacterium]